MDVTIITSLDVGVDFEFHMNAATSHKFETRSTEHASILMRVRR